jgi:Gly-Xaa carboxypeptidase
MSLKSVLLTGLTGASALVPSLHDLVDQLPLGRLSEGISSSQFLCDLPPAIDPASDGLFSADDLFSTAEALFKQIERHQAIVRVPTVSYDDNGEPGEDERWAPFWDLHQVLESLFPIM